MSFSNLRSQAVFWPFMGFAALMVFNLIFDRDYFELTTLDGHIHGPLITTIKQSSRIMLLALGMTLVIATAGVDLSVGSLMAVCAGAAAYCSQAGGSFGMILILTLFIAIVAGGVNGVLVARVKVQPIVATLIMMVLLRGVAFLVTDIPLQVESDGMLVMARGHLMGLPTPIFIVIGMLCVSIALTKWTAIGLFVHSVGDNATASRFCGLPATLILILVYVFCGICAGLAGLLSAGNSGVADPDKLGLFLELDAITAVVVGGTALTGGRFTLLGSAVGALIVKTMEITLIRQGMNPAYALVPKALIILIVCLLLSPAFRKQLISFWPTRSGAKS